MGGGCEGVLLTRSFGFEVSVQLIPPIWPWSNCGCLSGIDCFGPPPFFHNGFYKLKFGLSIILESVINFPLINFEKYQYLFVFFLFLMNTNACFCSYYLVP